MTGITKDEFFSSLEKLEFNNRRTIRFDSRTYVLGCEPRASHFGLWIEDDEIEMLENKGAKVYLDTVTHPVEDN